MQLEKRLERARARVKSQVKSRELRKRIRGIVRREAIRRVFLVQLVRFLFLEEPEALELETNSESKCSESESGVRGNGAKKLDLRERIRVYKYREEGRGVREIARLLKRAPSTISKELARNRFVFPVPGLDPYSKAKLAQDATEKRRGWRRHRLRLKSLELRIFVGELLMRKLSPQNIAGRAKLEGKGDISGEAIYRWVYEERRDLVKYLRSYGKRARRGNKHKSRKALRQPAAPKVSIEKRPARANNREELGHWEMDTIVSKKSKVCMLVLQERVSRFFFVFQLSACTAKELNRRVVESLNQLPKELVRSITCDNGSENAGHEALTQALKIPVYFCHPYCSSERGGVERRNRDVRRFFPKGSDLGGFSQAEIDQAREYLINQPMKVLGFLSPLEVFHNTFVPMKLAA